MSDSDRRNPDGLCRRIELPVEIDERGRLTHVEESVDVPIDIERVYYIHDVPSDTVRGRHAHESLEQVMIAVAGRLDVVVDDGSRVAPVTLDSPSEGLYVPQMRWRMMTNFEPGTVCLVLASEAYDPDDYIHDYAKFLDRR